MLQDLQIITQEHLLEDIAEAKKDGYRFAALTCEKEGQDYELTYHLDKNYVMKNIRIVFPAGAPLKSISSIYPNAFLIENEYQDLYGFVFEGLTIDYKGKLYLTDNSPKTPLL